MPNYIQIKIHIKFLLNEKRKIHMVYFYRNKFNRIKIKNNISKIYLKKWIKINFFVFFIKTIEK